MRLCRNCAHYNKLCMLKNIERDLTYWCDDHQYKGGEGPMEVMTLRMPDTLAKRLAEVAQKAGSTTSEYARLIIADYLNAIIAEPTPLNIKVNRSFVLPEKLTERLTDIANETNQTLETTIYNVLYAYADERQ